MNIRELLGLRRTAGEVGIEIELEGGGLGDICGTATWRIEHDGSLRGESLELVLRKPVERDDVHRSLDVMLDMIEDAEIRETTRAGIHVHINIQELTSRELVQFIVLYMIFEETLVQYCGEHRVGNLFCLSTDEAPFNLKVLAEVIKTGMWRFLDTDDIRYASMNLKAIPQYGSLEFRAMRSTTDVNAIQEWVNILLRLKDVAREYESPPAVIEELSVRGPEAFFKHVLGEFPLMFNRGTLIRGVRNAQIVAYGKDWNLEEVNLKVKKRGNDLINRPRWLRVADEFDQVFMTPTGSLHTVFRGGVFHCYVMKAGGAFYKYDEEEVSRVEFEDAADIPLGARDELFLEMLHEYRIGIEEREA